MTTFAKCRTWIWLFLATIPLSWGGGATADEKTPWATGTVFQRRLADPVTIQWANIPLRQAIERLARVKRVAIVIDRRVDPTQKLNLSVRDMPLEAALREIASRQGLGVAKLGNIVYFGPASVAERLPAVATSMDKDVRRLPPSKQRKFFSTKRMTWDDLAQPRELLAQLARESGLKIEGLDKMPHDLWAATELPPLTLVHRLTLVAIQFDLVFKVAADGRRLDLVPAQSK